MNVSKNFRLDQPLYSKNLLLYLHLQLPRHWLSSIVTEESTSKTVSQPPKPTEDRSSDSETPVQQVSPLLGTTPRENLQLQNRNTPDDISDVLGTCIFQGYVETPLQTLDDIVVNQPKRFLPLAEEANARFFFSLLFMQTVGNWFPCSCVVR